MRRTAHYRFSEGESGFTLPEMTITLAIIGILFAIASSSWQGVVEGREVDSAANQMGSDLRLAHTSATNRLTNWQVVLSSESSSYQVGPADALRTRNLPDSTEVYLASGGTITIVFGPDGSAAPTGSPIAFEVRSATDGNTPYDIEVNTETSRVRVD